MDSKKAERFEKHRKELRKKAFLNIGIILLVATGIGFYAGGYVAEFLMMLALVDRVVVFSMMFVAWLVVLWALPLLHYREKVSMETSAEKEQFTEKNIEESPMIKSLEKSGWKKEQADQDKVVLSTYPTKFHEILGRESKMTLEIEKASENEEIHVLKRSDKEIAKTKTQYDEIDEGLEITETTVSLARVSPVYIEVSMFLMPEIEQMTQDTYEQDIEITDEQIDYRFSQYQLE